MMICNHDDDAFKKACFDAYNRWIAEYCAEAPDRLLGAGQTALRTIDEGIGDLVAIADAGLRGVMMPGEPGTLDRRRTRLRRSGMGPLLGGRCRSRSPVELPHPHIA